MDLPDEASRELARALDELKLQGVLLLSHIRGKPLTDPRFRPFFEEADRRGLFVLIHPMLPMGMAEELKDYVLGPLVGFPFDSTLAVARMCFDGLFQDFPRIRFLVPAPRGRDPLSPAAPRSGISGLSPVPREDCGAAELLFEEALLRYGLRRSVDHRLRS